MSNEYASRRELLVLLFGTQAGVPPGKHALFIQKVIKHKAESVDTLFDNHEFFFPESSFLARQTYRDMLNETRDELLKGRKRTASAKGQLEYILDSLNNMQRHCAGAPGDSESEEARHFIYRTLNDYLQFHTRDKRLWHTHPVGDEWASDDKLTMVYTAMCLPGHYFKDEIKLALMTIALRVDINDYDGFLRLSNTVADSKIVDDWMFRTQRLVPISEMDTHRNIRCLPRQDKLASLASYLMRETTSTLRANRQLAESVINDLPERIDITGPELNVWVSEIKKFEKNQKKVPATANLNRLDLVWLLANVIDPQQPTAGVQWLTDTWHHNYNDEEGFLAARFNKVAVKEKLHHFRKQIEDCTDSEQHTDENKFKQLIGVLRGLFQNENVYTDRLLRQQVVQLRNHLPHYLGLCDNYVAMWNSSLPLSIEVIAKKESLMSNLVSYPIRRRMVATVLFSKELYDTTKAELLCVLASNGLNTFEELMGWVQNFKPHNQYKIIQDQLSDSRGEIPEIKDGCEMAISQLMLAAHNLGHAPGMDGNTNLAKFLSLMVSYLGISQRMHDEFYKTKKDTPMKNIHLHAIHALSDPRVGETFPAVQLLGLMHRICSASEEQLSDMEDFLVRYGCSSEFIKPYLARYGNLTHEAEVTGYRSAALRSIASFFKRVQKMPNGIVDQAGLIAVIETVQTTLKVTRPELAVWEAVPDQDEPKCNNFFEIPNAKQSILGQQSQFRDGFDVSHAAIPYKAPNDNLAQVVLQGFNVDAGRGLRTLLALAEAEVVMGLTDEQLAGAYRYLFRHGPVGALLRIPRCEFEAHPQKAVEHLVYWTTLMATQMQMTQPNTVGQRMLNEDQIKTLFSYIESLEKRQTLIRLI